MNSDQFETGIPAPQGLYDFEQERDACGVGLVADLKNEPSHKIIEMGITVLKRLMHRGAVGSDPDTGDGAGILLALPDEFFRLALPNKLPARGKYGVAMMFGGCGHEEELEAAVTENGGSVIAWRQVPVDRDSIGKNAQRTCPLIRQLFIDGSGFADQAEFERKLFVMRREMERRVEGCYVCSCSSRSIVYKGLFLGTQIEGFYGDLASEHFKSPLALVHQRYSTNTFPTWSLAHPFRYLAHNGEINTLRGNLNHLSVREPHLSSTLLGDDLQKLLPLIPPGQSDSACLDNMVELLAAAGRDLRHVMLMLMPQAFPLAILLSSLITFGNLGESSELTAIKAAGISLMQAMRSLIVIVCMIACCSFYFQNVIGPDANKSFSQLLLSMKQKSPELEIPEGIFYDGIPGCNLYVQKKEVGTGMLYGVMIYRMNGSYEDAAIILADSGKLQSTAEKKHLLLTLYSGEWFENMQSQDIAGSASVPYRRETFGTKQIVLDFDGGFNMADVAGISADARSKSIGKIMHDLDSIRHFNDSVGHSFYNDAKRTAFSMPAVGRADSLRAVAEARSDTMNIDSVYLRLSPEDRQRAVKAALNSVQMYASELDMKGDYMKGLNRNVRTHQIEAIGKVTLALSCVIFFFIGAPLGAIIRKGGLGVPVIISVLVFIVYFIFENSGMKMARDGVWTVWFGKLISTAVLTPLAVFFTYKANNDSVVFNFDIYRSIFFSLLGIRQKRHVYRKEVIINDPDYAADAAMLEKITLDITEYSRCHNLLHAPNPISVFFREGDDRRIREISVELEAVIEDLSNTRDKVILTELNRYPIMATHAHTRPFRNKWLNATVGILLPLGVFFYLRMLRFRLRLLRDLRVVRAANDALVARIAEMDNGNAGRH